MKHENRALQRLARIVDLSILTAYTAMIALILLDVLLFYQTTSFFSKKPMPLPQWIILSIGAFCILLLTFFLTAREERSARSRKTVALLFWAILFVLQSSMCYFSYSLTDCDPAVVLRNAHWMAAGWPYTDLYYYIHYPNNALITLLFAAVMRVFYYFAPTGGIDRYIFFVIVFQCALNTGTGMLTHRLALRWTHSRRFAQLVTVVYAIYIGLSPWLMIPYSDPIAIFFPVALLNLYDLARHCAHKRLCWLGIALLSMFGMLIKPQTVIMTIALLGLEFIRLIRAGRLRAFAARFACVLLALLFGLGPLMDMVFLFSPLVRDKETAFDAFHYLMMGLNEPTNGGYYDKDVDLTVSITSKSARRDAELAVIRDRLAAMDMDAWKNHLMKKTLTNYADGTFAWGVDFSAEQIEDKDSFLSPLLKDLFNARGGARYPLFQTYDQCIWLALLFFSLASAFAYRGMASDEERFLLLVMLLGIIGLTLFEIIFEARARYLLCFAPIYLLVGLRGAYAICASLRAHTGNARDARQF